MAEANASKPGSAHPDKPSSAAGRKPTASAGGVKLRNVWPIPALVLGVGLLVAGAAVVIMSGPKAPKDIPLEQAKALVQEKRYQEAIDKLNGADVRNFLDHGGPTPEHWRAFYLARARAFSGAQATLGLNKQENHKAIVEDFENAEKATGRELEHTDISILVGSLVALDEVEEALKRIGGLPDAESARKTRLYRSVVEHNLALAMGGATVGGKRADQTLDLLARLSADPGLSAEDKAWVLARQAEMLIAAGRPEEAITKLIRRVGLQKDVPPEQQGELYVLLGKAYYQADQPRSAMKQLDAADALLGKASAYRAELGVLLGRLAQSGVAADSVRSDENDPVRLLEYAREKFEGVISEFAGTPAHAQALLGLAEVEAALQHDERSLELYAELVEKVKSGASGTVTRDRVTTSLMQRFGERFDAGNLGSALRYAGVTETLYKDAEAPANVLLAIGKTRRALGDRLIEKAKESGGAPGRIEDLDAATRAEVRQDYIVAGDYLRRHARAVAADDLGLAASSLWTAADSYDLAGDLDEAKKAFADYAESAADSDPNKPAARFRLAQVLQARKEYAAAAGLYRGLVGARDPADPSLSAGGWSDLAIVPLAKCLLIDGDPANRQDAERLLLSAVDGSHGSPDAPAFRDAVIELGGLYYRAEQFPRAIERLEQAAKLYKDDPRADGVKYMLADSHRREAASIRRTLASRKMPPSEGEALESERIDHLRSARGLYEAVRASLEPREAKLSALDKIRLRNAYFFAGDCAMDMKDYDGAIAAYDAARVKYSDDPASLVAMAQIVSAYADQGKWEEARTANERAKQQLARFPESVWQNPDLPMEKRHWEKWLEARTRIQQQLTAEGKE